VIPLSSFSIVCSGIYVELKSLIVSIALVDMHVDMEDTDFDVEVPLLFNQGYECSQNQEVEGPDDDDVGVESLDFDPLYNLVNEKIKKRQLDRKFYGYYANQPFTKTLYLDKVKIIHLDLSLSF